MEIFFLAKRRKQNYLDVLIPQDSYVFTWFPNTNYNNQGLEVFNGDVNDPMLGQYRSFIRLKTADLPVAGWVDVALHMYCTQATTSSPVRHGASGAFIDPAAHKFDETTITWNNKPAEGPEAFLLHEQDTGDNAWAISLFTDYAGLNPTAAQLTKGFILQHSDAHDPSDASLFKDSADADTDKRPFFRFFYS